MKNDKTAEITVRASAPYSIVFRESFAGLAEALALTNLSGRKLFLVTDTNVAALYLPTVRDVLCAVQADIPAFVFDAGEEHKNIDTLQALYAFLAERHADRRSVVLALGGGVVGDLAGFAAATYMRGISFVQIPTTLLAQVDASCGGKTAIDFAGVKNLVGAFHQPDLVFCNVGALATLPADHLSSGMAEVLKHGLIADAGCFAAFAEREVPLFETVVASCKVKAAVVAADEREQGLREILNFGHCVGHAVESLADYKIPHGHCVAVGMMSAVQMSAARGHLTAEEVVAIRTMLTRFDLPTATDFAPAEVLRMMYKDKKTRNNVLRVVLLRRIGEAYTAEDVAEAEVLAALAQK